jgi:hypothetical protein
MYKLKSEFKKGSKVILTKSFEGFNEISLDNPTQSQLKHLFDLGNDYVGKIDKPKKQSNV